MTAPSPDPFHAYGVLLGTLKVGIERAFGSLTAGFDAGMTGARSSFAAYQAVVLAQKVALAETEARRARLAAFEASGPEARLERLGASIRTVADRCGASTVTHCTRGPS